MMMDFSTFTRILYVAPHSPVPRIVPGYALKFCFRINANHTSTGRSGTGIITLAFAVRTFLFFIPCLFHFGAGIGTGETTSSQRKETQSRETTPPQTTLPNAGSESEGGME